MKEMRPLTEQEILDAPVGYTHYNTNTMGGELFYIDFVNLRGVWADGYQAFSIGEFDNLYINCEPIPTKATNITTHTVKFKKGDEIDLYDEGENRPISHFLPDGTSEDINFTCGIKFTKDVTITIKVEVKENV